MGIVTGIAWTDHTYNSWIGCTKVGPGCVLCYAAARDERFDGGAHWGAGAPRRQTSIHTRNQIIKWDRAAAAAGVPAWVFCQSLSDVFDNEVPDSWRSNLYSPVASSADRGLFDYLRTCVHLRPQIVTKRIGNAARMLPYDWRANFQHCGIIVTVCNQDEADRDIPKLIELQETRGVRWVGLSIEPMLGPMNIARYLPHLQWVIVGGESAQIVGGRMQDPRTFDGAWALSMIQQCGAADVPLFVKQLGGRPRFDGLPLDLPRSPNAGNLISEWPLALRVRQMPRIYDQESRA